ncbi:MAG TPA: glycosyltransferase family 61 protein [Chthoniobacterales bacterium]
MGDYLLSSGQTIAIGDRNGNLFKELSFDIFGAEEHSQLSRFCSGVVTPISGRWIVLLEPQAPTYGHWLIELVPRLLWMREQLGNTVKDWNWFISGTGAPHEIYALEKAGIDPNRVKWCHQAGEYLFDEAWIPGFTSRGGLNLSPEAIDRMRNYFCPPQVDAPPLRVYLSRQNERFRKIVNEGDIIAALEKRGYSVFHPREMSLEKKVEVCSRSEIFVTCISSGTVHAAFMKPGGAFVEVMPKHFFAQVDWALTEAAGLHYIVIPDREGETPANEGGNRYADVEVDIPALMKALDLAENLVKPGLATSESGGKA